MSDQQQNHKGHDHCAEGHSHVSSRTPTRRLAMALGITGSFMVVEIVAGWLTGSLALLSDAGHMLTDAGALILAILAQWIARRPRSREHTFGFRRAEVLAGLANGVVLGLSSVWIVVEAIKRFKETPEVKGLPMLIVASVGLLLNLVAAKILASGESNANVRAAAAHVAADAAGSVAAIIAGIAVLAFGWNIADPIVSIAISALILWSAWKLVREAIGVLMECHHRPRRGPLPPVSSVPGPRRELIS